MPEPLTTAVSTPAPSAEPEDVARAGVYGLLAGLLRDIPGAALLEQVQALEPANGGDDFSRAWEGLRLASRHLSATEVDDEYHQLFIGLGRGELVPYGSWYQTGFLMEQPLGVLRRELAALGFARQAQVREPEDHVAALCEVMGALAQDPAVEVSRQRAFYWAHLRPWVGRFCSDLEAAESAVFYKAVARLGARFFELEERYLDLEV